MKAPDPAAFGHPPRRPPATVPAPPRPSQSPQPTRIPYPKNPLAAWNRALIEQEAARQANAQLDPLRQDSTRRTQQDTAAMAAAGKAAAEIMQGLAPNTQNAYATAARDLAGITGGETDSMKAAIEADRAKAAEFAASQGSPAPNPTTDLGALGDTIYHGGAAIPAASLESQGAAATAANEGLVGAEALQTQQNVRGRLNQGEDELLQLAEKYPELHDQVMNELYKRETEKLNSRLQARQVAVQERAQTLYEQSLGERVRHDTVTEQTARDRNRISARRARLAEKNYNLQVSKHQEAVQQAQAEGRTIDPSASKVAGHLVANDGSPILDNHGNQIPVATGKGTTPKQNKTNIRMAGGAALRLWNDAQPTPNPVPIPGAKPGEPGGPIPAKHPMTFAQAQGYLASTYGISRSKARQILVSAGWKPDGQRPRAPRTAAPGTRAGN